MKISNMRNHDHSLYSSFPKTDPLSLSCPFFILPSDPFSISDWTTSSFLHCMNIFNHPNTHCCFHKATWSERAQRNRNKASRLFQDREFGSISFKTVVKFLILLFLLLLFCNIFFAHLYSRFKPYYNSLQNSLHELGERPFGIFGDLPGS